MEFFTHALASYAITKALFPRAAQITMIGAVAAGTVADLDLLSAQFSPSAFLEISHTYGHSALSALIVSAIAGSVCAFFAKRHSSTGMRTAAIFAAMLCAAALHLLLDMCQADGVALLWPFSEWHFSADWLPHLDIWILLILLAGLLVPKLFGLVTDEIGVKSKPIRGRREAAASLFLVVLYICLRIVLHADAIAALASRSYGADLPRTIAALPVSQSPLRWLGLVETEGAWHLLNADIVPGGNPKISGDRTLYKPEDSPALNTARNTPAALRFLRNARFPKATVEKTESGVTRVTFREAHVEGSSSTFRVAAIVDFDSGEQILKQQLGWEPATK
ncbi:MAG: hypothetical protein PVS2B2_20440 [Candidatus Acidiferrum sp.]